MRTLHVALGFLAVGTALAALGACSTSVSCDPGADCGPGGGNTPSGAGGSTSSSNPGNGQLAAILYGSDPLTLRVTSFPLTCAAPDQKSPFAQCGWEDFELTFPAGLLTQGSVSMGDSSVQVFEQMAEDGQPGQCGGSAGSSGGGTGSTAVIATFSSVGASSVTVTLTNVDPPSSTLPPIDGTYVATRCP